MEFIEERTPSQGFNVIMVVMDHLSKNAHFTGLKHQFSTVDMANRFTEVVIRLHSFSESIVSDKDMYFLKYTWKEEFRLLMD